MIKQDEMVSVIIPVYNTEKYIEKCITSIINQTYRNLEVIAVDNSSRDSSVRRIKKLSEQDDRIRLIKNEKTHGVGYSRNVGLDNARGKYIWFVDSDDYAESNFLEKMVEKIRSYDVNIVQCCYKTFNDFGNYTDTLPYNEDKLYTGRELCKIMSQFIGLCGPNVMLWNKLYKKEVFNDKRFYENVGYEDMHITYKILYEEKNVLWISDRLMNWRKSIASNTARTNYMPVFINELYAYIERAGWYKEKGDEELYALTMKRLYYTSTQQLYLNRKIMSDDDKMKREGIIKSILKDSYKELKKMNCFGLRTRIRMKYISIFPAAFGRRSINHTVDFRI
ncbi:MAG: glycosyltransferase [Lachnospiraceae bacterium]|nr:glycosyltransferase [Lachnospiraceae bacterium]